MNPAAAVQELRAAMARLEPEPTHTEHVARLAVRLFDDLRELHGFGVAERTLLEGAAFLHDIGWPESRNGSGHHKISARLIRRQKWTTLSPTEVDLLAQVARYHRRAHPCSEHGDFHRLDADGKRVVRSLAALLRLADALDRSHLQRVRDLKASADSRRIRLVLLAETEPAREIAACAKKGVLASEVFDREILVEASLAP